ncbi:sugar acetyltransferase [Sporosarcina sp. P19]|uniref:acetyltransferase n=1 Tax=Sporosarcina sp. P19 TaxID=2048258 RepID=UPI000C170133|nr:acetyltransferase [Sporosarcina sp. P19]PIC75945.1 sugar acetyltransferase [Sporosarcina sp. P19]
MNKPIIIIGDGGHASVLLEILHAMERKVIGYTSPKERIELTHIRYLGTDEVINDLASDEVELVIGLGTINVTTHRKGLFEKFKNKGYAFTNVIHPSATLSPSVCLGEGTQIMAGAIVQTNVKLVDNIIINTGAIIDHDCNVKSHVHIAPGVTLSGNVYVGESCHIGVGATVIQGVAIGDNTLIGAGSVVITDIASNKKAYGVPAKEV